MSYGQYKSLSVIHIQTIIPWSHVSRKHALRLWPRISDCICALYDAYSVHTARGQAFRKRKRTDKNADCIFWKSKVVSRARSGVTYKDMVRICSLRLKPQRCTATKDLFCNVLQQALPKWHFPWTWIRLEPNGSCSLVLWQLCYFSFCRLFTLSRTHHSLSYLERPCVPTSPTISGICLAFSLLHLGSPRRTVEETPAPVLSGSILCPLMQLTS
jgi:hypothetical protein